MRFKRKALLVLVRIQSPKPFKGSDILLNYLSSRSAHQAKTGRLLLVPLPKAIYPQD